MGHEEESFDDFVKAQDSCQEDLMFFPAHSIYEQANIAENSEKLFGLQNEFEILKKRIDDGAKKATKIEQKIKVLTHGYQVISNLRCSLSESTFKQLDNAGMELECLQSLQNQEQLAATSKISVLAKEVNRQMELERKQQHRYGDLLA